jgi:hypothetical protein
MSKQINITVSDDLYEAIEILRKRNRYRSKREYLEGMARFDAMIQKEHVLSLDYASLDGWERDRLDSNLLALVKSGKGKKGEWFENQIRKAVESLAHEGVQPTREAVAKQIVKDTAALQKPNFDSVKTPMDKELERTLPEA